MVKFGAFYQKYFRQQVPLYCLPRQMSQEIERHILARYKPLKKIGSGAYGIVWKVFDRETKSQKALKKNFDAFTNSTDAQRTYREIMFLKQLKHPNIIVLENTLRAFNDKDIYLVFEHMDIDLHSLIRENANNEHLQERHKQFIIYQIAKALYYLHNSNIIHRDLKPSNVLVNENCEAKLCDFGLVRSLEEPPEDEIVIMTDYIATRWYRAPELLMGSKNYSKEVDIWALGCLVAELMKGKPMFPGNSTTNQIEKILTWTGTPTPSELKSLHTQISSNLMSLFSMRKKVHRSDFFPHKLKPQCMDLITRMLDFNPSKRPSIEQVLSHEYLSEFYNEKDMKQISSSKANLKLHINDNKKLSLNQYRNLIYGELGSKNVLTEMSLSSNTHQNNHLKSQKRLDDRDKKVQQKDKTNKKLRAEMVVPEAQGEPKGIKTMVNYTSSSLSKSKKNSIFSEPKTNPKNGGSLRKKGISLCSKSLKSNNSFYNDTAKESMGSNFAEKKAMHPKYRKIKTVSKGVYDSMFTQQLENAKRKVVYTNVMVNDQIGKSQNRKY